VNLLAPLAAGFADAPSGSVDIYVRGTSTRASYFATFEGNNQVTPSASIPLDSNGRLLAYVNVLVDCVVKDTTGTIRCGFTAGETASTVEVRSASFTGTDYTTGVSALSNPNDLETILDKWTTSAGKPDWNVLSGGLSLTIQAALASVAGLFYNVKTYGAAGDGVADDTSAIAAAITAAGSGIVFFPSGTYRTTSALTVPGGTSLLGTGTASSSISIDHASANLLTLSANATAVHSIVGLKLTATQANSGIIVNVGAANHVSIRDCYLGGSLAQGVLVKTNDAAANVAVTWTTMQMGAAGMAQAILCTLGSVIMVGGDVVAPSGAFNTDIFTCNGTTIRLVGVRVDCSPMSSGAGFGLRTTTSAVVCGCTFINQAGGTVTAIVPPAAGSGLLEQGNVFGSSMTAFSGSSSYSASAGLRNGALLLSREFRVRTYAQDADFTIDSSVNYVQIIRAANTAQTVTLPLAPRPGMVVNVLIYNGTGGAFTNTNIVFNGASSTVKGATSPTSNMTSARFSTMRYTSHDLNGSAYWHGENPADNVAG
jgi:hypothetical protein